MRLKKILPLIMLLSWMGFIFLMSTDFGASEGKINQSIVQVVKTQTGIDMNKQMGEFNLNFYFRKNMHLLEFAVFGLLVLYVMVKCNITHKYLLSLSLSLLYAATDEFHQAFVKGRTPLFTDVLIDTCGALLAITIIYIIEKVRLKYTSSKAFSWSANHK